LHVDPADDPEIGKPATFFFEFKDKQDKFSLGACDCKAQIFKGGIEVYSNTLSGTSSLDSPLFQYTFTEKGIYTVKVLGSPKAAGEFQNFSLAWDVRVEKGENAVPGASSQSGLFESGHTLHFILLGGAIAAIFGKYAFDIYKKKKEQKKSNRHIAAGVLALFAIFGLLFHQVHAAGSGCAGETAPSAHECCLPVLADTSAVSEVSKLYITIDDAWNVFQNADVDPNESINNKSPPVA
jgi:hypothetical protein